MSFLSRAWDGGESRLYTGDAFIQPGGWPIGADIPTPYEDSMMAGGFVPEGGAMRLGAFYACVTLLADIISSLDIKAYRSVNGVKVEVDPQPRLLMNSPYPETTWFSWLWMMMEALAVTGNAFGYITAFDESGPPGGPVWPTAIMPIHPSIVNVVYSQPPDPRVWPQPAYNIGGESVPIERMVHIKRYPIAGAVLGMSPVQKAAAAIGLGLAAERYGYMYFRDASNPSGVLTTDQDLTPDQMKKNMKSWVSSHQGRRLPAVLSGGFKWQSVTLTPEESQFLETRTNQVAEIARWFRIPLHMIQETTKSTSWGSGLEQQAIGFVTYTLNPWLACLEQAISAQLPRGQNAKFDVRGLLRGDVTSRWDAYKSGRDAGVYSVNDIRQLEDLPPVKDGDGRIQPLNFGPLGSEPPPPKPPPPAQPAGPPSNGSSPGVNTPSGSVSGR